MDGNTGSFEGMWGVHPLTVVISTIAKFQSIAVLMNTLIVGVVTLMRFLESFVALGKGSLDGDTTELSTVDVLYICQPSVSDKFLNIFDDVQTLAKFSAAPSSSKRTVTMPSGSRS